MDKYNTSFEPMDIDQSVSSSNDMDISFQSNDGIDSFLRKINDSVKSTPTLAREEAAETPPSVPITSIPPYTAHIKKFHIIRQKDTVKTYSATKTKLLCAALIVFLSAMVYQVLNIQCYDDIDPDNLRKSLSNKLYGQKKAIDELIEGLAMKESKVLILYGSTGVGKTFAASIILDNVGPYSNVYHYTMPSFMVTFTTDFMVGLTVCKDTIIIIDDLRPNDLDVKLHIANLITKSENLEKFVTVLLIYNNCNTANNFKRQCDENFPNKVMDNFKEINVYKKMIRFETLTEDHLRKCIETELGNKRITNEHLTKMLRSFDVNVDGCKGVHTKMKLLDIS